MNIRDRVEAQMRLERAESVIDAIVRGNLSQAKANAYFYVHKYHKPRSVGGKNAHRNDKTGR